MRYVVEICSDAMLYVPSFIKIDSVFQKLMTGTHRHPDIKVFL
jgi:hypothetical protein